MCIVARNLCVLIFCFYARKEAQNGTISPVLCSYWLRMCRFVMLVLYSQLVTPYTLIVHKAAQNGTIPPIPIPTVDCRSCSDMCSF